MLFDKINRLIHEIVILFEVYPQLFQGSRVLHAKGQVTFMSRVT